MSVSSMAAADRLFHSVVGTEFAKLRRSKITWISFLVYAFMAGVAGFFMWMMKNPGMAASLGLIGQKAQLAVGGATVGWEAYLFLVLEMSGLAGMILASVILTYVFGREYAEGTAKNMLAMPVPRWMFTAGKLVVAAAWFAVLTLWQIALVRAAGALAGLGEVPAGLFGQTAGKIAAAALMGYACAAAAAWIAVETRGYFAPLGYAIFTMLLAVIVGATEWGRWCPWSILLWYTGASGPGKILSPGSFVAIGAFFAASVALILRHETRADNVQ
jgi:ABC-2 type transport system permease protein